MYRERVLFCLILMQIFGSESLVFFSETPVRMIENGLLFSIAFLVYCIAHDQGLPTATT